MGMDIDNDGLYVNSGQSVSLSADGTRVAIGAPFNDTIGTDAGQTRVYEWSGSAWTQLSLDIYGEAAGDESGASVSLSADGTRVAVGAKRNGGNAGHTRVYELPKSTLITTDKLFATSNIGIGTTTPAYALDVVGDVHANYFVGDGSQLTGVGIDTTQTLALSNVTTGLTVSSNALVTGNVTANYFVGDGSQLTGVGIDTTQTLALSNVTTGLTVSSNAIVQGDLKLLGSMYYNDDLVMDSVLASAWTQMGGDIDGEAANDYSGRSVSVSADGTRVAIGAPGNSGNGGASGHTRVYEWSGSVWTQMGGDIDGEAGGDQSGYSVSLSTDGTRVAIGAWFNDGVNGVDSGHTRVYEWSGSVWTQLGGDIDGEAGGDQSGYSVSLSADGTRVAIGALVNTSNTGHTRVYEWSGSVWTQLGGDIDGEAVDDKSGYNVSLSADGTRVAIGAPYNDGTASNAGHTRVYEWSGSVWTQMGGDIDGEAANDNSGYSVSLSADGTRVAIGASGGDGVNGTNAGHVRMYEWSGGAWTQMGMDIDGEAQGNASGWSVSLSADGTRVAIGAWGNDDNGTDSGHTRVYEWSGSVWTKLGGDIDGEAAGDYSGYNLSLSADGTRVAIGAWFNDDNGTDSGHTRVYELPSYKVITTDKLFATSNIGIGTTTPAYALDVVGEIYASGTITQSSDIRRKSNLHVISEPMDKLNQIHGYMYDMDGKHRTGLVAQEVLEVLPEAVTGSEQSGYGLAYGDTIGLLVEAIKELNKRIVILETN
jgi:hypothetical protein